MMQNVKTTIRWRDSEGNTLGAFREVMLELPDWGKLKYLREEARSFINLLLSERKSKEPKTFADYAFNALSSDKIFWIKSKTNGSCLTVKGNDVATFIKGE